MARALLVLENGAVFAGESFGAATDGVGELIFNTSMTGYQEVLTDPSYTGQVAAFTQPHIGNVGVNAQDAESDRVHVNGMVIGQMPPVPDNWRSEEDLSGYLRRHHVAAIAGVDVRRLTRLLREQGALRGCIHHVVSDSDSIAPDRIAAVAREVSGMEGTDLIGAVTTERSYDWEQPPWRVTPAPAEYRVIVYDFGVKRNILRLCVAAGCRVTVVPATTPVADVLAEKPDGILLSNGPGDPAACASALETIRELLSAPVPLFGICLGFQLLALAAGARTVKMKFGHHGANHPVRDLDTGQIWISSQNHGFAVDEKSLPDCLRVTHRSLFDGTLQGLRHDKASAFGFQGHPEASPGPHDAGCLLHQFVRIMKEARR